MATLTEEQIILRDSARAWAQDHAPVSAFRRMRDTGDELAFNRSTFSAIADMGWTGLAGPVRAGAIVVCHYQRGAVWKPEPLSAGSAVLQLLSNTVSAMAAPALTLACLSPLVKGATCLTGARGEAGPAAALMLQS